MSDTTRPLFVAALVVVGFAAGALVGSSADGIDELVDEIGGSERELSGDALDVIDDSYFRDIDDAELEQLQDASVQAMVRELRRRYDDRFSHYFPPDVFAQFQQATHGSFSGVGLAVNEVPRGLRVATVYPDAPAERAGIRKGDIATAVNGKSIAGTDAELATARIKGPPGSTVKITVLRPSTDSTRELELTRAEVDIPAVETRLRDVGGTKIGYIRLLTFTKRGVHAELRRAAERLRERGAEGLLIDLRGNGGGLLTEAILTSSVFVEDGVIVSTRGRTQPDETFEAQGDAVDPLPMAVLIDNDSASASEIFAAAMRDAGLATLIGEKSFGKGVFQEVIELGNGGALDLTVGEYLTRDRDSLAGKGLEPEIPARDRPATKPDEGLDKALDELAAKIRDG
ncbi:MAG: S41 family peptidase [Solirubrobacterales bacterium]